MSWFSKRKSEIRAVSLKQFVTDSLVEIVDGIVEAQDKTRSGQIVPTVKEADGITIRQQVKQIDFEVSVRADQGSNSKAELTVVSGLANGGASGGSNKSESYSARLSFSVPVEFRPHSLAKEPK